ncbi:hypothetical protein FH972_014944 [Carpinus fangiana]|uniref:Uncharacterized protein n=1 Tax=Carpinus fangiana TaxID=176857 RepID=A0A5N6RBK9_9ROSI|nr:hypothetical protein FH972_014944 [Carpinus fangiana]
MDRRVLAFRNKSPTPVDPFPQDLLSSPTKPLRCIPKTPERILAAVEIVDDFNSNLLDWGSSNVLAIALGNTIRTFKDDHTQKVGSLAWNNHPYIRGNGCARRQWLHKLEDHTAPVRALAWCPFQSSLLVSGRGLGDECIKFWDTSTGVCENSVDAGSEVCALLWNTNEEELLSSHGYDDYQLTLWKYPSMKKLAKLVGHSSSVHYMAQSPNGCTVASAAGDELLVLWNVFGTPGLRKPAAKPFALASCIQ